MGDEYNYNNMGQQPPQGGCPQGYPRTGVPQGYPQGNVPQGYPQGYPQNNVPQGYPQNNVPQGYPQNAMQQGYPQSGIPYGYPPQPYPMSGYMPPQKEGLSVSTTALISVFIVVAVALIVAIIILFIKPPPPPQDLLDYSAYKVYETEVRKLIVDDTEITLPQYMLNIDSHSFISVQDFANVFGYSTVLDKMNRQTRATKGENSIVFSSGIKTAVVIKDGEKTEIKMEAEPLLFTNDQTYVPLTSMKEIFNFWSIEWDESTKSVIIETDGITVPVVDKVDATKPNVENEPPPPPNGMPPRVAK